MSGDFPLYYQDAWRMNRVAQRPVADQVGRNYGLLAAAVALVQVFVSNTTAANYQGPLITLQHANDTYAGAVPLETIIPPALMGALSAIIFGIFGLIISYFAASNAAHATRDAALGQRAGIITALLGAFAWLVFSVLGAFIGGNDGFILVVDPFSTTSAFSQMLGIAGIAAVRALLVGGLSLLPAWFLATIASQVGKDKA